MSDIFQKCRDFKTVELMRSKGVYPYFAPLESEQAPEVMYLGRMMVMAGSNNYLGLANDPRMKQAVKTAVDEFGTGCAGSRFLNGNTHFHEDLEIKIAKFKQKEAGLIYATGYQMNTGTVGALVGKGDFAIVDKLDHASILDGVNLSGAEMKRFKHNDAADLDRVLSAIPDSAGKLVIVDGVFSMEGDICDLPALLEVTKKHKARIMIDDAHATGVLGKNGRGTTEHFGIDPDEVDIVVGTCSKSLATVGGFCVGKSDIMDYIRHNARSMMFSAALPAPCVASISTALDIIEQEPQRRKNLWDMTRRLKTGFDDLGFDTGHSETPIIPIMVRDNTKVFMLWKALLEEGIFTNPVVSPAVPPSDTLVRVSLMATHTKEHIDRILTAFDKCAAVIGIARPAKVK
ncbi:MAG: pyridoxal phosphate-dependent aminotransferase family protein [Elusimicrobiaceae bacterium]|nr:pyridoxal phosphate-dependent aminotransferase family protein [Elusimicrobiaceae bacterium]